MEYINLEYYPIDDLKGTGPSVANSPDVSSPGLKVSTGLLARTESSKDVLTWTREKDSIVGIIKQNHTKHAYYISISHSLIH